MMNPVVLVVDDSLTVRMDLTEALESAGLRTLACSTATDAREAIANEPVALVVLDVLLPDADGIELLREFRAGPSTSRVPVLMLSTEAEVRDRIRGLETGADEYVGKPYDTQYVVSRARELIRLRDEDSPSERRKILVIDDSATFRGELRQALEDYGYEVLTAASGEEGLRVAADARPHAIIVDGLLPGIDGAAVVRRVRLDGALRRTPCLFLTASEDEGGELRALDAGADAFVRKEDDVDVILARLAATLRAAPSEAADAGPASLLSPKKILAVDDSATQLHELAGALRGEGYDVIPAHSGEEALEMLAVQPVDCILLDLLMPGIGGQETCRRIKSAPGLREVPLIMLTALEERSAMIEGLGAGADDYIAKSSDFQVLRARVRAQLRRRQFEDENRQIREQLLRTRVEAAEARAAREIAEARARLVEELEKKNRELESFSYSVSHDLRAPLRAIDGFSQALLEDYDHVLDGEAHNYIRRVRAAARRMGELIDDLLELSRVERAALHPERIDLSAIARQVAEAHQRAAPERDVRLQIEEGLVAEADARLIRVLFENLIGNAWKFTSRTPQAIIEFGVVSESEDRIFLVRDNGSGFDMAYASRLFAPFQRLHSDEEFPGTGIGLATVRRIVDRHGGRVWAEGELGRGATISWTLPEPTEGERE